MLLVDVNVLVYAHRADAPDHAAYKAWLEAMIDSEPKFGMSDLVLSGFLRIVTSPRIFISPTPLAIALAYASALRDAPSCVSIAPGPRHWEIFADLCQRAGAKGNLVPDAYLAALAIESGSEWITTDRDFSRFPKLRWRHPLEHKPNRS
jgi:toxin-antitoxin system PIN domain toxin